MENLRFKLRFAQVLRLARADREVLENRWRFGSRGVAGLV
jgi:hypothetical protein